MLGYGVELKPPAEKYMPKSKKPNKLNIDAPRSLFMYSPKLIKSFTWG
jgi:hypothetical protein